MGLALVLTLIAVAVIGSIVVTVHDRRIAKAAAKRAREAEEERRQEMGLRAAYLIFKHEAALLQRIRQALYRDAYGQIVDERVGREVDYFIGKILLPEAAPETQAETATVLERFWTWMDQVDFEALLEEAVTAPQARDGLSYERQVGARLVNAGYSVSFTPMSGDQGVDLIAERAGERVAIQCKNYESPVGNDAVQQAFAGAAFYGAQRAAVVAPNGYTTAARQLAASLGVRCLHHDECETLTFGEEVAATWTT